MSILKSKKQNHNIFNSISILKIDTDQQGKLVGGFVNVLTQFLGISNIGETNLANCSGDSGANNCNGNCTHGCSSTILK